MLPQEERPGVDADPWARALPPQERGDVDEEESWASPSGDGGR